MSAATTENHDNNGAQERSARQPSEGIPELAICDRILDRLADDVAAMGVAGERRVVQLIYLVATTRLSTTSCLSR